MCVIYQDAVIVVLTRNFHTVKKSKVTAKAGKVCSFFDMFKLLQGKATTFIVIYLTLG